MNELALFAGGGGGILASELLGWNTICAVEIKEFPRKVLLQRQKDGIINKFPIWDDIRTFDGFPWRGSIDIISGGFPCQYFSTATHGRKTSINLWPEMGRIISEVRPHLIFCENVSRGAIIQAGIDLWRRGYSSKFIKIGAKDLGADHIRSRFWLLAYTDMHGEFFSKINAKTQRMPQFRKNVWETKPNEFRMADDVANRMDRIKAIGNGQIPIVAATAFNILINNIITKHNLQCEV